MSELCSRLHHIIINARRYTFETGFNDVPRNGIYIMFEKGEFAHGVERIVRIGTHTGANQLQSRIKQHYLLENKNRSIFRKNIGRCFLNGHDYAEKWEYDITSKAGRGKYELLLNTAFEKEIEHQITKYIQENLSFVIIAVHTKEDRLSLEAKLISTVSVCDECKPSGNWLGLKSPKAKIVQSGLWQINELYGTQLKEQELESIENHLVL